MGIGGNALNIYVFAVRWKANMAFTFFLSCLAACHIAKCAICGPLLIYTTVRDVVHGELPNMSCILIRICFVFFTLIASFILTLLAIDRCRQVSCFWVVAYCVRRVGGRSVNQSGSASGYPTLSPQITALCLRFIDPPGYPTLSPQVTALCFRFIDPRGYPTLSPQVTALCFRLIDPRGYPTLSPQITALCLRFIDPPWYPTHSPQVTGLCFRFTDPRGYPTLSPQVTALCFRFTDPRGYRTCIATGPAVLWCWCPLSCSPCLPSPCTTPTSRGATSH